MLSYMRWESEYHYSKGHSPADNPDYRCVAASSQDLPCLLWQSYQGSYVFLLKQRPDRIFLRAEIGLHDADHVPQTSILKCIDHSELHACKLIELNIER